jgi:hypothetical protein
MSRWTKLTFAPAVELYLESASPTSAQALERLVHAMGPDLPSPFSEELASAVWERIFDLAVTPLNPPAADYFANTPQLAPLLTRCDFSNAKTLFLTDAGVGALNVALLNFIGKSGVHQQAEANFRAQAR